MLVMRGWGAGGESYKVKNHVGRGAVIDDHQSKYIKTFNLEKLRVHLIFISVE